MNDGDSYDRLIESALARHESEISKLQDRMLKQELWRNTVLVAFATLVFIAGAASRDLVALLKHIWS